MEEYTDPYYELLALDYQNAARLSGFPGCVLVEGEEDVDFWKNMFSLHHYHPDFLYYTHNKSSNPTSGISNCLKFKAYACMEFLICIDSDYRYPVGDTTLSQEKYLLQTYAHSIENHYAHFDRFNLVCREASGFDNTFFDFKAFEEAYAENLYPLFLWQVEHLLHPLPGYQTSGFLRCINESHEGVPCRDVGSYTTAILEKLKEEVKRQLDTLGSAYPDRQPAAEEPRLAALGITPRNTFLFIRGHNLRFLVEAVGNAVVNDIFKKEKEKLGDDKKSIHSLYKKKKKFGDLLVTPPFNPTYPELRKVWESIRLLLAPSEKKENEKG